MFLRKRLSRERPFSLDNPLALPINWVFPS